MRRVGNDPLRGIRGLVGSGVERDIRGVDNWVVGEGVSCVVPISILRRVLVGRLEWVAG